MDLRGRFLVAMGLPLASCAKHDPPAATDSGVTTAVQTVTAPAPSAVALPDAAAEVASALAPPSASASAAPVHLKAAPSTWSVSFKAQGLTASWCPESTATCFPQAHVPRRFGDVRGSSGSGEIGGGLTDLAAPESSGPCAPSITVPCGCTPGGGCPGGGTDPCPAPLVQSVSRAQSAIYAGGACCYEPPQHCLPPGAGRALSIDGVRVAVGGDARSEWHIIAAAEHASIASFARASLELMALGAPAGLIADTHRAALDEVRHARVARALAGDDAPAPALPAAAAPIAPPTFESFVRATFRDACVEETLGAVMMRERAARYGDHRESILSIAEDEERHAELAWRTLAWAVRTGGESARVALRDALRAFGLGHDVTTRDVIVPCALALL